MGQLVPGMAALRTYRRAWLPRDLAAGIVLATLLVPQGMAYAELAGLPPITGLYTTVLCLLGYAVFGPSWILVLGPDSALGPMIAATLAPLVVAADDPKRAVALASALAVLDGVILILAATAKLGFVATLLSKPTIIGYMNGLALTILVGQLPKLFGFSVDAKGFLGEAAGFVRGVADGKTVGAAVAVGLGGISVILVLQRWLPKLPAMLIAVLGAILAVQAFDLTAHGVSVIGVLPRGFPPFTVPRVELSDIGPLLAGAAGIALVSLADTISTATSFAGHTGQEVHGDGEMRGIGAANLAAAFFQGFPVSTSASRTAVAERAGAKTQLTGVIGAAVIVVLIVLVPGLFRNLPQPAMAAVVITAALSMVDLPGLRRLWRQRRTEWLVSVAALLSVVLLGVLPGVAIAVALSILNVFRRLWRPYDTVLGRVSGVPGYHDIHSYPEAERLPGLVIFRFDAPLIFANATTFRDRLRELAADLARPGWIVVAAEPITDLDTTATDMLTELHATLARRGVSLVFAELKDPVRHKFQTYARPEAYRLVRFFPTVEAAVSAFQQASGSDWNGPPAAHRSPSR